MGKNQPTRKLSAKEQRDLDIEIGFLQRLVQRDPEYIEALQILADDYARRGNVVLGLQVDEQLCVLCPADPSAHYNLACSHSLAGHLESAVESLERAFTLGFHDLKSIAADPDLNNIRNHPRFKRLQAKLLSVRIIVH